MYTIIRKAVSGEWREHLQPDGPGRMRIGKHGSMKTDAIMVADSDHLDEHSDDRSPNQLVNTASLDGIVGNAWACLLYTSPSPRDRTRSRMPSSA